MLTWGLNQMTMCNASAVALLDAARHLGIAGVELRNDLTRPLFEDLSPEKMRSAAERQGLGVLALAEVYGFNGGDFDRICGEVDLLCQQALACGSDAIVLIPEIAKQPIRREDQITRAHKALARLMPVLENAGVMALIEPVGFLNSSLRFKADAVRVFDDLGRPACFGLVHDTFHHYLSGEADVFAELTRIVHISGVKDITGDDSKLNDAHRGLIGPIDRLKSISQISHLQRHGYTGAFSFEAFSPDIQTLENPVDALAISMDFITNALAMTGRLETE